MLVSSRLIYPAYFGNTFNFYNTVLARNSIDNKGMSLIGSIHFDDEQPPPGYGKTMAQRPPPYTDIVDRQRILERPADGVW